MLLRWKTNTYILKFNLLFLWYSREWIGVPKSFKSKDRKSYPNRSKTYRNMKIFTVASYSLRFFLFSWPVLGDETLNSYLPTTIKMCGTSFNLHILHGKLKSILEPIGPPSPRCLSRFSCSDWEYYYSLLNEMLVHRKVTPKHFIGLPWKFARGHLCSWLERGTLRGKRRAQEHKTLTRSSLAPRPLDPKSYALTVWRLCHPYNADDSANNALTLKVLTTCYRIQIAPGYARGVRLWFPLAPIIFCKAKNCKWKAP